MRYNILYAKPNTLLLFIASSNDEFKTRRMYAVPSLLIQSYGTSCALPIFLYSRIWLLAPQSNCTALIMKAIASQITSLTSVIQPFIQAQMTENFKAPRHWPLTGEFLAQRASNAHFFPCDDVIMGISLNPSRHSKYTGTEFGHHCVSVAVYNVSRYI